MTIANDGDISVNSKGYWDWRFEENWIANDGPNQSAFFTQITIERLPVRFLKWLRQHHWTLVDWGCALGDGTAPWRQTMDARNIFGVDISSVGVATAQAKYPDIHFSAEDWLNDEPARQYDVVYSSNTLEHFRDSQAVLAALAGRATQAVVLTIAYRERDCPEEHFVAFFPANIPTTLPNGMTLVSSQVMLCEEQPNAKCTGEQIILLYVNPVLAKTFETLEELRIEHDDPSALRTRLARATAGLENSSNELREKNELLASQLTELSRNAQLLTAAHRYTEVLQRRVELLEHRHSKRLATRIYRLFKPPVSWQDTADNFTADHQDQPNQQEVAIPLIREARRSSAKRRVDIVNINFFDWDGDVLYKGGAERYVFDLAQMLQRDGWDVRLLQRGNRAFKKDYRGINVVGIAMTGEVDLAKASVLFRHECRDADLVISSPAELSAAIDRPCIGINHGIYWDCGQLESVNQNSFTHIFDALRNNARTVAVDTNFINWARTFDVRLAKKITYVPNYWDANEFQPSQKSFDGRLRILYPRRLYGPRGIFLVMEAFQSLLVQFPEIDLHLVGQANETVTKVVANFVARFGDRVIWEEFAMEDMHKAYASSHIALIPTVNSEGTSLSCLEAMATRNAIIATNVGGLPNLVIDNFNGKLIDPTASDLHKAVVAVISDRAAMQRMADNGVTMAQAFEKSQWLARWRSVIRDVCSAAKINDESIPLQIHPTP